MDADEYHRYVPVGSRLWRTHDLTAYPLLALHTRRRLHAFRAYNAATPASPTLPLMDGRQFGVADLPNGHF